MISVFILSLFILNTIFVIDSDMDRIMRDNFSYHIIPLQMNNNFDIFLSLESIFGLLSGPIPVNDLYYKLKPNVIFDLKPHDDLSTVVIYPQYTAAAYSEGGFYDYYSGECDIECLTVGYSNTDMMYRSSGITTQLLYQLGYDIITDSEVDQDPFVLQQYDRLILLHNEYITPPMYDAIMRHQFVIHLFPNSVFSIIESDHHSKEITLIADFRLRDLGYGGFVHSDVSDRLGLVMSNSTNMFMYSPEIEYHEKEFDTNCIGWEFAKVHNGYHLTCYPDVAIIDNLDILQELRELKPNDKT